MSGRGPTRELVRDWLPVAIVAVGLIGFWKGLTLVGDIKPFILPPPESVAVRFATAWTDGTMPPHALASLTEIVLGFLVGGSVGLVAGYLLARSGLAERVLSPYLVAAQATPILAIAPLIALWFGTGLASKVVICGLIAFFPVAIATMVGIRSVDAGLLELARSLRASRVQIVTKLEIPAALPSILGGIRVGLTLAVIGAIVAEWAGGDRGLGILINLARGSLFDTPLLFATLATIALIGIVLYVIALFVERRLVGDRG